MEAQFTGFADRQMIVKRDAQRGTCRLDLMRHVNVGLAGGWITGGVVVHENEGAGVQFEGALHHFTRVDRKVIDGALGLRFVCNEGVLAIKEEEEDLLGFAVGHGGLAIVEQGVPQGNHRTMEHAGAGEPACRGFDDLEFANHRIADAMILPEAGC